jgi:hypothetical protein
MKILVTEQVSDDSSDVSLSSAESGGAMSGAINGGAWSAKKPLKTQKNNETILASNATLQSNNKNSSDSLIDNATNDDPSKNKKRSAVESFFNQDSSLPIAKVDKFLAMKKLKLELDDQQHDLLAKKAIRDRELEHKQDLQIMELRLK